MANDDWEIVNSRRPILANSLWYCMLGAGPHTRHTVRHKSSGEIRMVDTADGDEFDTVGARIAEGAFNED